jgi:hypothetical protein
VECRRILESADWDVDFRKEWNFFIVPSEIFTHIRFSSPVKFYIGLITENIFMVHPVNDMEITGTLEQIENGETLIRCRIYCVQFNSFTNIFGWISSTLLTIALFVILFQTGNKVCSGVFLVGIMVFLYFRMIYPPPLLYWPILDRLKQVLNAYDATGTSRQSDS